VRTMRSRHIHRLERRIILIESNNAIANLPRG
jgi:hypothetical protein